jgi:hypothetical protein
VAARLFVSVGSVGWGCLDCPAFTGLPFSHGQTRGPLCPTPWGTPGEPQGRAGAVRICGQGTPAPAILTAVKSGLLPYYAEGDDEP